ncbi:MAG: ABC transporter ATP-binding protein, partial [Anaerolineae bacterium]|nr:ABC transporter ATP-binding protein [Anaerolineae bacterium]
QTTRDRKRLASIRGMVPDPYALPRGCHFHPRCDRMMPGICDRQDPQMVEVEPGHKVRCLLYNGK